MHCDAQEAEGTEKPKIQWQRVSKFVTIFPEFYEPQSFFFSEIIQFFFFFIFFS